MLRKIKSQLACTTLLVGALFAEQASAVLVVEVDIDESQFTTTGIFIPLPTFTIPDNTDTISFRFTENEQLKLTTPLTGTFPQVGFAFRADTDGAIDDTRHFGGSSSFIGGNDLLLPGTTGDLSHIDSTVIAGINRDPIFIVSPESIDATNGQMFILHGIDLVGGIDFDPATLSEGRLSFSSTAGGGPFDRLLGTVEIVPEPSSLAVGLIGIAWLVATRRRR
ncbi:MAG: PEP-CTERM sorting domain-containing protein [Planctomycetota bacterium]